MSLPSVTKEYRLSKPGAIDDLVLQESPVSSPGAYEVLIKVHAVSLNYRDLIVAWGQYPGAKPDVVPCSDLAGEILAVGDKVTKWAIGDRVCANFAPDHISGDTNEEIQKSAFGAPVDGMLTQFKIVPAHCLVQIPEHLSYEEASTLPCAAVTAWNALQGPTPLKGGDTVLVQGTGGVSIFALQLASAMGAKVIVTSSSNEKLEKAWKLGADHAINYKEIPDWDQEVLKLTGGRGVDHVIEVGGPGTLPRSIRSTRMAGWIHNIGFVGGTDDDLKGLTLQMLFRGVIYRSVLIGSRTQFEDMNRLLAIRQIKPVVDKVFGFDETKEAFNYLAGQKHIGKVVIRVA